MKNIIKKIGLWVVLTLGLFQLSQNSFLLFHTLVELIAVIVAVSIFLLAWNIKTRVSEGFYTVLAGSLLGVAGLDLIHTLTYRGMDLLGWANSNIPTQLWLAGRMILAAAFLLALGFINRRVKLEAAAAFYLVLTAAAAASIMLWKVFPAAYVEGQGLTGFKVNGELLTVLAFVVSIYLLRKQRHRLDPEAVDYLSLSLLGNAAAGIFFVSYSGVYDWQNIGGHVAKLVAYYYMYKAILQVGLTKPYEKLLADLKDLNDRKDELLGVAGHEIKTPLTSIKAYAQILSRQTASKGDDNSALMADKIDEQADLITKLINELMDMSRIQTGRMVITKKPVRLSRLVKQLCDEAGVRTKNHIIEKEVETGLWAVADKARISQVINNLINNAIKYSPEGSKIRVRLKGQDDELILSVKDEGMGIPKSKQVLVFEKYFRTPKGERKTDGLGLGLYISKEIVLRHGGRIWLKSKKGKGSEFLVALPGLKRIKAKPLTGQPETDREKPAIGFEEG